MFHRVLSPSDARWSGCDPDYTLDVALFARCLDFFRRHYNVVSIAQVLDARATGARLPPRALLITFDDGWQDYVQYAMPAMHAAGMPGLLFVVADAIDRIQAFYQERIIAAWRRGRLSTQDVFRAFVDHGLAVQTPPDNEMPALRKLIGALEALQPASRKPLIDALGDKHADDLLRDDTRHMVKVSDLHQLRNCGIEIGLHGKTHEPLTRVETREPELRGARQRVADLLNTKAAPATMSFPHGKFTAEIANEACGQGFELVFTSVPAINPARPLKSRILARLGFETDTIVDRSGNFRPELMALYLFRQPLLTLPD